MILRKLSEANARTHPTDNRTKNEHAHKKIHKIHTHSRPGTHIQAHTYPGTPSPFSFSLPLSLSLSLSIIISFLSFPSKDNYPSVAGPFADFLSGKIAGIFEQSIHFSPPLISSLFSLSISQSRPLRLAPKAVADAR